jgi:hypothetical protein
VIVIRDVESDPHGPTAAASRDLVDEALALRTPDGGGLTHFDGRELTPRPLREGGIEAWEMVLKLRARAWHKAGADPDMLFTREEVLERAQERARRQIAFEDDYEEEERERLDRERAKGIATFLGTTTSETHSGPVLPNAEWEEWENLFSGGDFDFMFDYQ